MASEDAMDLQGRRNEILRIASTHGARNLRLFGSVARGEDRPGSDLDLLVDMEPGRSLIDLVALGQDLEDLLQRKVDVLTDTSVHPALHDHIRDAIHDIEQYTATGRDAFMGDRMRQDAVIRKFEISQRTSGERRVRAN